MEIKKVEDGWEYAEILFESKSDAVKAKEAEESSREIKLDFGDGKPKNIYNSQERKTSFGNAFAKFLIESDTVETIESVAKKIGVSRQALHKWIKGESMPDPGKSAKIKKVFGWTDKQLVQALQTNNEYQMVKATGIKLEKVHKYLQKSA